MNEEIDIILARYFSGEITEKENQTLEDWLAQSDVNEKQFQRMSLLYQNIGQTKEIPVFDTEKAFSKFKNHINKSEKPQSHFRISYFLKVAAAIAVLLISCFALFYLLPQSSQNIKFSSAETSVDYEVFENTKVTLFANSEIITSSKKENNITLVGRALFKVDSKTSVAGIIVQAGETFIKDIGTVFTVDATHPDKSITVEVSEGEVWFYTKTNDGVYIKQNESAVYDVKTKQFSMIRAEEEQTIIAEKEATSAPSIEKQEIVFNSTPLVDVVELLKIKYGVDIIIKKKDLKTICLNASFDADESVENILEIISESIGAKISKGNDTFYIYR